MGNSMLKLRRPTGRPNFNMELPILIGWNPNIVTVPWVARPSSHYDPVINSNPPLTIQLHCTITLSTGTPRLDKDKQNIDHPWDDIVLTLIERVKYAWRTVRFRNLQCSYTVHYVAGNNADKNEHWPKPAGSCITQCSCNNTPKQNGQQKGGGGVLYLPQWPPTPVALSQIRVYGPGWPSLATIMTQS